VSAKGDGEAEGFNCQSAEDEGHAAGGGGCGEEHDGGNREEKSGGQNEQSGVFHLPLPLQRFVAWIGAARTVLPGPHIWMIFRGRLRSLYEF
jgi:hypothetical protein